MNCNHETDPIPVRFTVTNGRTIDWYKCIHCGEEFTERNPTVIFSPEDKPKPVFKAAFTFYKWEIQRLLEHIGDANSASFDIDQDGYVIVHVAGKNSITL